MTILITTTTATMKTGQGAADHPAVRPDALAPGARQTRVIQGPPEYGRSCDYSEQVTIIAYTSLY